jgi:Lrp/AsnC family transcriptional regulator, leucine-responsive regulatory protein
VSAPVDLDRIDRQILELLERDARRTLRDIASRVNLTVAPVKRRIERLESSGVIEGYTVRVNRARTSTGLQAMTELRFTGDLDLADIVKIAAKIPEVEEILTIAGDQDAIVRLRVDNVEHLQRVVNRLRTGSRSVVATKTLVVLGSWVRSQS